MPYPPPKFTSMDTEEEEKSFTSPEITLTLLKKFTVEEIMALAAKTAAESEKDVITIEDDDDDDVKTPPPKKRPLRQARIKARFVTAKQLEEERVRKFPSRAGKASTQPERKSPRRAQTPRTPPRHQPRHQPPTPRQQAPFEQRFYVVGQIPPRQRPLPNDRMEEISRGGYDATTNIPTGVNKSAGRDRYGCPKVAVSGGDFIRSKWAKWVQCKVLVEVIADDVTFDEFREEIQDAADNVYEAAEDAFMDSEIGYQVINAGNARNDVN